MQFYRLFRTVKTVALYHVPIKIYSKNTHGSSILKWILVEEYKHMKKHEEKKSLKKFQKNPLNAEGIWKYFVLKLWLDKEYQKEN